QPFWIRDLKLSLYDALPVNRRRLDLDSQTGTNKIHLLRVQVKRVLVRREDRLLVRERSGQRVQNRHTHHPAKPANRVLSRLKSSCRPEHAHLPAIEAFEKTRLGICTKRTKRSTA